MATTIPISGVGKTATDERNRQLAALQDWQDRRVRQRTAAPDLVEVFDVDNPGVSVRVDVSSILDAFAVTCPAVQSVLRLLLSPDWRRELPAASEKLEQAIRFEIQRLKDSM